ncbi:MAG: ArnT family glycosyltransferase [Bradymonadia bacterium]
MEAAPGPTLSEGLDLAGRSARPWIAAAVGWSIALILSFWIPPFADEAYYADWSRSWSLGHFDHPPGVAWWMALSPGSPRVLGLIAVPLSLALLADAGRRLEIPQWRWVPALILWTPLGMAWPLIVTPDMPLLVCWSAVIWATVARKPFWCTLALAGCLWSKPAVVLALPGLWWCWRGRGLFIIAGAFALYSPHLWWSAQNDWLPFSFQGGRAWTGVHIGELIGGQLALISPVWCGVLLARRRGWRARVDLWALSLPIFAGWALISLVMRVEANWPALAWPAAALIFADEPLTQRWRSWMALAMSWGGLAVGVLIWITHALPVGLGPPRDGESLSLCLEAALGPVPMVATRYQERALLGNAVQVVMPEGGRSNEYIRSGQSALDAQCGFVLLGDVEGLAGQCAGRPVSGRACHRPITWCRCKRP